MMSIFTIDDFIWIWEVQKSEENLSAKETPEKQRTRLQKKNENCIRQKDFIKKKTLGQKETFSVKS